MAERRGVKPWEFLSQLQEDALDEWAAARLVQAEQLDHGDDVNNKVKKILGVTYPMR